MVRLTRRSSQEEAGDARILDSLTLFLLDIFHDAPLTP